jgi:hypothetical protein
VQKKGEYCYYSGDALKLIKHIDEQILRNCQGNTANYITILPINIYFDGKLHELPLFRFSKDKNSSPHFVDPNGRTYRDFRDWREFNKLPPAILFYPKDGVLKQKKMGKNSLI